MTEFDHNFIMAGLLFALLALLAFSKKRHMNLLFIPMLIMFSSCLYTKNAAIRKFCVPGSVTLLIKDTLRDTIAIPEIEAVNTINCDSFRKLYTDLVNKKSLLVDSAGFVPVYEDSNVTIKGKPNADGSTTFKTKTKPKEVIVEKPVERIVTVPCKCPPPPEPPKPKWYEEYLNWLLYLLAAFGLIFIIRLIFKK